MTRLICRLCCVGIALCCYSTAAFGQLPSQVFFCDPGQCYGKIGAEFEANNNKPSESIVLRGGVIVRGWIQEVPYVNHVRERGVEDLIFNIVVDPDVPVEAAYPSWIPVPQPMQDRLLSASLPGNPRTQATRRIPLITGNTATINTLWLFDAVFPRTLHIELNAWHETGSKKWCSSLPFGLCGQVFYNLYNARGAHPSGWVEKEVLYNRQVGDFTTDAASTWWPFDPESPDGAGPLKIGDYVQVGGTLWQDGGHPPDNGSGCWSQAGFLGHEGYLELHPIDSISRLPVPTRTQPPEVTGYEYWGGRTVAVPMSVCARAWQTQNSAMRICPEGLSDPRSPRTGPVTQLAPLIQEIVDPRFTSSSALTHTFFANGDCAEVSISAVGGSSPTTFKATYLVKWERALPKRPGRPQPRPRPVP